jgi:hypothetical protein
MLDLIQLQPNMYDVPIPGSFPRKIRDSLLFVANHPESASQIGLIPYGQDSFLVNSKTWAQFIGLKFNSCNRNFQDHGFKLDSHFVISQELRNRYPEVILSRRKWLKRTCVHGPFNAQSTDVEIARAQSYAKAIRARTPHPNSLDWSDSSIDSFHETEDCLPLSDIEQRANL